MELKPMFETSTIKFVSPVAQKVTLEKKVIRDPSGEIPNGIYKVILWEKRRQLFALVLSLLILTVSSILLTLYATVWGASWGAYITPGTVSVLSGWKLFNTITEVNYIKRSILRYREDLKIGLTSTPPFITRLYIQLHKKQIAHNWITFTLMFYGGILTLLLWWLKDFSWWIFHFDEWIQSLFWNPTLMMWVFAISLLCIMAIHIVFAIGRKRRVLEINAYFGSTLLPESEIEKIKVERNKGYRRIFIISLMVLVLIPIIVKIVMKTIKRKK